jgi:disulfide bond formation protein DsbB
MRPNRERYKYMRIAMWIGAPAGLLVRFLTQNTTYALLVILAALVIGLIIDLVVRKA